VIALISRLVGQKGLDLITHVFDELIVGSSGADGTGAVGVSAGGGAGTENSGAGGGAGNIGGLGGTGSRGRAPQFVMLGTGDTGYENFFRWKAEQYAGQVSANLTFDEALAHRIYAGADFLLMPSLFEPCGISQLIAMRYGTLPIVRETGGLADTVWPYNEVTGEGTGYSFANINAHELLFTMRRALGVYANAPEAHNRLMSAAMARDDSWGASAKRYVELYENI
ncbi:MAG: glycosyltransferase, partial [Clostridiales bacterium]|jgi:glycogen synthase|nr:glycosyltransferase [Clostridiales bacterium]